MSVHQIRVNPIYPTLCTNCIDVSTYVSDRRTPAVIWFWLQDTWCTHLHHYAELDNKGIRCVYHRNTHWCYRNPWVGAKCMLFQWQVPYYIAIFYLQRITLAVSAICDYFVMCYICMCEDHTPFICYMWQRPCIARNIRVNNIEKHICSLRGNWVYELAQMRL